MKRVINAAGYSPEARALDHNFYVRDEAGKLYGPYFDAQDVRFGDEQLLFVKPKSNGVYHLLDENCKIMNDKSYYKIVGKAFGKYILVEDNDKYFLLNQELEKCSEEFYKVYKNKSYDKFLTVEQNGETFRLYPDLTKVGTEDDSEIVEISNDNEEENDEEVIEYFSPKSNYDTMYLRLRRAVMRSRHYYDDDNDFFRSLGVSGAFMAIGAISPMAMGVVARYADISEAAVQTLGNAMLGTLLSGAIVGIIAMPFVSLPILDAVNRARVGIKKKILNAWYAPENVEKRNIKKITKNSKKMNRINKKLERLNKRKETLQEELDDLTSERKADLTARRDALLERAQTIENKMKIQAGDFVSDGRKDRKLEKMEQKAGKKSKKLGARQAEINKLREELEKLETENEIRAAEYVAVNREKADKMERQSAEIDKARNERPLLDELVELEDGAIREVSERLQKYYQILLHKTRKATENEKNAIKNYIDKNKDVIASDEILSVLSGKILPLCDSEQGEENE